MAQALPNLQRLLGRHHPDVALTVNNLAVLERNEDRLARAEALFRRAAASFGRALGPRHPHTVLARENLRAVRRGAAQGNGRNPPMTGRPMTNPHLDLVVRGGTVVTAEGRQRADIGVAGGRVAQIGGAMTGAREIDADGRFVLPGGVDPHVHLNVERVDPQRARLGRRLHERLARRRWRAESPPSATCRTSSLGRRSPTACAPSRRWWHGRRSPTSSSTRSC